MNKVGEMELAKLPPSIESCCVIYLPHVGYLLAIPPFTIEPFRSANMTSYSHDSSLLIDSYDIPGLQFMFSTSDMVVFKSPLCSGW